MTHATSYLEKASTADAGARRVSYVQYRMSNLQRPKCSEVYFSKLGVAANTRFPAAQHAVYVQTTAIQRQRMKLKTRKVVASKLVMEGGNCFWEVAH